jgi:biopolymer transport protein ExbD
MHSSSSGSSCEPNLTPLLDLVLQILMFFMVTVQFTAEDLRQDIALPFSEAARPLGRRPEQEPIYVSIKLDSDGKPLYLVTGQPPKSRAALSDYLKDRYDAIRRYLGDKAPDDSVPNPVIIRPDRRCGYAEMYSILELCSDARFTNLKMRAQTRN